MIPLLDMFARASICSNCHAVCHGHTCAHTSSLACRAVRVYMYYLQRILASTRLCRYMYIATHDWLQPKTDFHRTVRMYYVVIRKVGHVVLCSATYTETSTGQHQGDAVFYCKEAHRTSGAWAILARMKRSEVPRQLHSTITPQMLHREQKYLGMLSTKLLGN